MLDYEMRVLGMKIQELTHLCIERIVDDEQSVHFRLGSGSHGFGHPL